MTSHDQRGLWTHEKCNATRSLTYTVKINIHQALQYELIIATLMMNHNEDKV